MFLNTRHQGFFLSCLLMLLCSATAHANNVTTLVEQRLSHMKAVAAYKWQHDLEIENLAREDLVLNKAVQQGLRYRLTVKSSQAFFAVQIGAAKEVQLYWFDHWRRQAAQVPVYNVDLDTEIRPELIRLGDQITAALASQQTSLGDLSVEGLSAKTERALRDAASAVEHYPNRLEQVLDSGILRVGTTGDYQPFSSRNPKNEWQGIDIDLAENLAASLGATVQWVHTSWPTLMKDFQQGQFDIGMSGISISLARQRQAFFSEPYYRGGKSALIRCKDQKKYTSLDTIDRPGTRLVVNPGGTNEKFVTEHIHQANVRVFEDNRFIFAEIIEERADAMITDQIEVRLQAGLHPALCSAMKKKTLNFSAKGYLLPRDLVWKEYVDTWLEQRTSDGTLERTFDRHLPKNN
ncbi:MAG: transporter substrate-binding domain-containing protein [Halioglobus sp.]